MSDSASPAYPVLDQLLVSLEIAVVHFTTCDIRQGWSVRFEPCRTASVHYCLRGTGVLRVAKQSFMLRPHTFVLLPAGLAYTLETGAASSAQLEHRARLQPDPGSASVPVVTVGRGGKGLSTACGELGVAAPGSADPFARLDSPIVTNFDDPKGLHDQFIMVLAESAQPGLGSKALVEALLKQCLVLALRRFLQGETAAFRWLLAIRDSRLGRALDLIFDKPQADLSVDLLAATAGMSRSAFAAAFKAAFDCSPIMMVRMVRLRLAADLLVTTPLPVADVARRVGFSSRSSFSMAFRSFHGTDPSAFRLASPSCAAHGRKAQPTRVPGVIRGMIAKR